MIWEKHAAELADRVAGRGSRWHEPVARTPRHVFVPAWWEPEDGQWALRRPTSDLGWYTAAYGDRSLITRVGPLHADAADHHDRPMGRPTSSATLPSLTVQMLRHARINDGDTLLDVGTGSGYGTALACRRLGDTAVTSVDVDLYLVDAARQRLASIGLAPRLAAVDATGPLPATEGQFDRIMATVSVRSVPSAWLTALRVGGRLVTTIAGTSLILTAEKQEDGGAVGRVEWDRAGFMQARTGDDYPPEVIEVLAAAHYAEGDEVTTSPYPVLDVGQAWDVDSMLGVLAPGVEHSYEETGDRRTAVLAHADGSWARATGTGTEPPIVHQAGPRRLWSILDEIRSHWLQHGELPVRGARVRILPDGRTRLSRGGWHKQL
ncbi:methyltransferase domain-containing protein [Streptomyces griseoviridis]|uniref:Protein-L-isoaspartate O-methyltransferase n=1 Tax=Streptomyces griseoviridis TaxID=45398 RepID=A0ABT9LFC5_STRGD|nr:methyltransferase domain-containing protein [Streptomyces griseoviridis]MDP9682428.1 protein-L-isoaspartate O-methyltransferase [Streptomyces griseoviridis]GGS81518.1 protein-L-isoaspartate O-methyltransferase [Streptomyces griseoviridis]